MPRTKRGPIQMENPDLENMSPKVRAQVQAALDAQAAEEGGASKAPSGKASKPGPSPQSAWPQGLHPGQFPTQGRSPEDINRINRNLRNMGSNPPLQSQRQIAGEVHGLPSTQGFPRMPEEHVAHINRNLANFTPPAASPLRTQREIAGETQGFDPRSVMHRVAPDVVGSIDNNLAHFTPPNTPLRSQKDLAKEREGLTPPPQLRSQREIAGVKHGFVPSSVVHRTPPEDVTRINENLSNFTPPNSPVRSQREIAGEKHGFTPAPHVAPFDLQWGQRPSRRLQSASEIASQLHGVGEKPAESAPSFDAPSPSGIAPGAGRAPRRSGVAPNALHPGQFPTAESPGVVSPGHKLLAARHTHAALAGLMHSPSVGGIMDFAYGKHLEPVHRAIRRDAAQQQRLANQHQKLLDTMTSAPNYTPATKVLTAH